MGFDAHPVPTPELLVSMTSDPASLALAAFALLTLVHVGAHSLALKAAVGDAWTRGARDVPAVPSALAGRLERALRNFLETAPAFLALMLAAHVSARHSPLIGGGAAVYLGARAAYLPAYASGLPHLRTGCWLVATLGLVAMLVGVLLP